MWAGNLYLGPFEITERIRESVIILKLPVNIWPAGWWQNLESLQSQESGELVSISRSETNLLKLSIVLRISLLYLYQIIGDSVFSKYEGIADITLLSRNMLGKYMNPIPLLVRDKNWLDFWWPWPHFQGHRGIRLLENGLSVHYFQNEWLDFN